MKLKLILLVLIGIISINFVNAELICYHETNPDLKLIESKFNAFCISDMSNYSCITMIMKDGNVINTAPYEKVKEFGTNDLYKRKYWLFNISYYHFNINWRCYICSQKSKELVGMKLRF